MSNKLKGNPRKSGSKKVGAPSKINIHEETEVFTTRDGHKKQVTMEEKKRLEWLKKNHEDDEKANVKPPAPSKPFIVKKSFDRVSIAINWRPPGEFCHPSKVKYAILRWNYAEKKESFFYEDETQENIGVTLYAHEAKETEKKIVNKKAKYITVFNLVPGQRYEFRVRFMYDKSVASRHSESHGDGLEGLESFPTEVHLPMRILFCTKCAATLLWGLEVCPRCAGEASLMPWMSGGR